jgi:hypothetical protein
MMRGSALRRAFLAGAILCLPGCATKHYEPPPAVIPQPPEMTANEAVSAEHAQEVQQEVQQEAQQEPQPQASKRAQRFRPTGRSTADIRRQNAEAAFPLDFEQRLDTAHDVVYTAMQKGVEATDRNLADKDRTLVPVPAAPFRLGLMLESIDRSDGMEFNFNANLDIALGLPNIEKRLRIFVTSDDLDESPDTARDRSGLRAGLRYQVLNFLDFDLGVRIDVPPVAFASLKWTREYQLGLWDFYPLAKVFIETKDGFGAASGVTFDRWSGKTLVRSSSYAKWLHEDDLTAWSQSLVFARAHELIVPDRYGSYPRANDIGRGWGVHVLASGEDTSEVTYYEAAAFYTRPMKNRWLFWSVEPLMRWDRRYSWKADPGVRIGFNALFWDLARPARKQE